MAAFSENDRCSNFQLTPARDNCIEVSIHPIVDVVLPQRDCSTLGLPRMTEAPVEGIPTDAERAILEPGTALCLSGGGYRAMVFHIGALWRLYEAGLLGGIKRISSVSG